MKLKLKMIQIQYDDLIHAWTITYQEWLHIWVQIPEYKKYTKKIG